MFKLFGAHKDQRKKINSEGIGLGLMISKMIVEAFSGTIGFNSKLNQGTTFYYTFINHQIQESEIKGQNIMSVFGDDSSCLPADVFDSVKTKSIVSD